MGWTIAAAYLVAAGLCAAYARRADRVCAADRFRLDRPFWWTLAAIMLLLVLHTWAVYGFSPAVAVTLVMGVIWGHLFWQC